MQNWFAARLTKWRKEEGFVPIAERAAILAQNMNETAKKWEKMETSRRQNFLSTDAEKS